jgi:predicted anti-sigma-YlaC factor YlaD
MSSSSRVALALVAALLCSGCSIRKMAVKTMADALSEGSSGFAADNDPELIKDALPFGLKTLETLSEQLPKHRPLLRSLASGFTSYAVAFISPEIRPLEEVDLERSRAQRVRARLMLLRARDYALRSLEVGYPGFTKGLREDPVKAAARVKLEDVPDLYWAAAAWGSAISLGKDQMDLVAEVPIVEALIRRAYTLDEAYDEGSIHEFLIVFESRGEASGGSYKRAREHFERAMTLSKGRKVGPLVALAENVSLQLQDRKEFDELLDRALAFDPETAPELRLVNLIGQRRARQLKAMADDLFVEDSK